MHATVTSRTAPVARSRRKPPRVTARATLVALGAALRTMVGLHDH